MAQPINLPLEQFNVSTPPGWKPHTTNYPLRRYLERLRLWYRLTNLLPEQLGPAVASRLQGRPYDLANALRFTLPDGRTIVGDEALAYPGADPQVDPNTGAILTPAVANGLQALLRILTAAYGADADQTAVSTLDRFFSLRRNRLSLLEYLNEHDYLYGEAVAIGGLALNEVGRSHFLLKHAGLPKDKQEHILLLVNQDLRQYNAIKNHLERMAKASEPSNDMAHYADQAAWYTDYDYDDGYQLWSDNYGDHYDEWLDDAGVWYDDWQNSSHDWQHAEEYVAWPESQTTPGTFTDQSLSELDMNVLYGKGRRIKGKGKGKGFRRFGKGKGKGKGKGFFPFRQKGKGKGKPWRTLYGDYGYDDWQDDDYGADDWLASEWQESAVATAEYFGKGKGKGKGKHHGNKGGSASGCDRCGSPNHNSHDCPWPQDGAGKGKGKGIHYEQQALPPAVPIAMTPAAIAAAPWSTAAWQAGQPVQAQTTWHSSQVNNQRQQFVIGTLLAPMLSQDSATAVDEFPASAEVFHIGEDDDDDDNNHGNELTTSMQLEVVDEDSCADILADFSYELESKTSQQRAQQSVMPSSNKHPSFNLELFAKPPPLARDAQEDLPKPLPARPALMLDPLPTITTTANSNELQLSLSVPTISRHEQQLATLPSRMFATSDGQQRLISDTAQMHESIVKPQPSAATFKPFDKTVIHGFEPYEPPSQPVKDTLKSGIYGPSKQYGPFSSKNMPSSSSDFRWDSPTTMQSQNETRAAKPSGSSSSAVVSGGLTKTNNLAQSSSSAADISLPPDDDSFASEHQTWLTGNFINGANTSAKQPIPMYHTVKGQPTYGLIFDPGASEALAGTQTVVEYCRDILRPNGYEPQVIATNTDNSFVGIDGLPLASGVRLGLLCNLGPATFNFETETIGQSGDRCPLLLPNKSAIKHRMISLHGHFPNGDGLLIMPEGGQDGTPIAMRMLLTDSGHYLIPLQPHFNNRETTTQNELKQAIKTVQQTLNKLSPHPKVANTWLCTKSGHWQKSDPNINQTLNNTATEGQNTSQTKQSTDNSTMNEATTTHVDPPPGLDIADQLPVSELDVFDDENQPLNLDPDVCYCCQAEENSSSLTPCFTCHNMVCTSCQSLRGCRDCLANQTSNNSATAVSITTCLAAKDRPSDAFIKKLVMTQGVLRNWTDEFYTADAFPPELNTSKLRNKMKHIPDEFYKVTRHCWLTPHNAAMFIYIHQRWSQLHNNKKLQWDFHEHDSGSGRVSAKAYKRGLAVGPPIDCRHGWNYDDSEHRKLLDELHRVFTPITELHAPECTLYCKGSAQREANILDKERKQQWPAQEWRLQHILKRHHTGLGTCLENPYPSELYKITPLAKLLDIMKLRHGSQCGHGAICPVTALPIRKETAFISDLAMKHTIRPCMGHAGAPHGQLQGRDPKTGLLLTQLAMRYPHGLADALVQDFSIAVHRYQTKHNTNTKTTSTTFANNQVPVAGNAKVILGAKKQKGTKAASSKAIPPPSPADEAAEDPPDSDDGELPNAVIVETDAMPDAADIDDDQPLESLLQPSSSQAPPAQEPEPAAEEADDDMKPFMPAKPGNLQVLGFGIKDAIKRLAALDSEQDQVKGLLALHGRFWHASSQKMLPLLKAAGAPTALLQLLPQALKMCAQCQQYSKPKQRPTFKTTLAQHFNHLVQADAFEIWGNPYLLIVDELFQFKSGDLLLDQTYDAYSVAFFGAWIRFFGPPLQITSDQGGALASEDWAALCDKLNIKRVLAGSDPSHGGTKGAKHTKTGLVEKHVDLTRLTMLKLHAYMTELGEEVSEKAVLFYETCCAHNMLLLVNGVAPIVGVLGNIPRDYHDLSNSAVSNFEGPRDDYAEYSTKVRLLAKVAALRAIVERRLTQAERSKPQKFSAGELQVGSMVDLYRVPKHKDTSGWRGPCIVLDVDIPAGTATIKWQSRVYLVPVRHLRPHVISAAFFTQALEMQGVATNSATQLPMICYMGQEPSPIFNVRPFQHLLHPDEFADVKQYHQHLLSDAKTAQTTSHALANVMDLIDNLIPGKPMIAGRVLTQNGWKQLNNTSPILAMSRKLELNFDFDGIRAGTRLTMLASLPECKDGLLITWHRKHHSQYILQNTNPARPIPFKTLLGKDWHETSFLLLFRYVHVETDQQNHEEEDPMNETAIDFVPEDDDTDWNSLFKGFNDDDISMFPPSQPSQPPFHPDATMQEPSISDESMLDYYPHDKPDKPDDRLNPNKRSTIKQHNKATKPITKKPTTSKTTAKSTEKLNKSNSTLPSVPEDQTIQIDDEHMQSSTTSNKLPIENKQHERSRSIYRPGQSSSSSAQPQPRTTINNKNDNSLELSRSSHNNPGDTSLNITGERLTEDQNNSQNSHSITGEAIPWVEDMEQTLPYDDFPAVPLPQPTDMQQQQPATNNDSTLSYYQTILDEVQRNLTFNTNSVHNTWTAQEAEVVIPGPWKVGMCFLFNVISGECYRVDETTDVLSQQDLITYEKEVIAADRDEIHSFIRFKVFEITKRNNARIRPMSTVWVRRWKHKIVGGSRVRVVKSRLCVRGFLDPQKQGLSKHSSTASRISQRLMLSLSINNEYSLESWDTLSSRRLSEVVFHETYKPSQA